MSNSDYTLFEELIKLGGRVIRSSDFSAWVQHAQRVESLEVGSPDAFASEGGEPFEDCPQPSRTDLGTASPLSMGHISPFIEWRAGASLMKVSKGGVAEAVGGGKRRSIDGFSVKSRRRLMQTIAGVRRDAELPLFVTLTYPDKFPDPKQSKKHLDTFFKRMGRSFSHGSIWKLEPQERGAPHYHLLVWGCDEEEFKKFVPFAWYEIAGGGDVNHLMWHSGMLGNGNKHCVQRVRSFRGVWSYASKYLGKTFDVSGWDEKWTGRYWGVIHRDNIPFGSLEVLEVPYKDAVTVMRYQRRFAGLRSRASRSQTVYCDADQWIKKLQIGGDE